MKIKEFEQEKKQKQKMEKKNVEAQRAEYDEPESFFSMARSIALIILIGVLLGFGGYSTVTRVISRNADISADSTPESEPGLMTTEEAQQQFISRIEDILYSDVQDYLQSLEDEEGRTVLTQEEIDQLLADCINNVTSYLQNTDLINLTEEEKNSLLEEIRNEVIDTVLNNENITSYFSEEDYKQIAEYISNASNSGVASGLKSLDEREASHYTTVTNKNASQDKELDALNDLYNKIQTAVVNNETGDKEYMNKLKALIDSNANISE